MRDLNYQLKLLCKHSHEGSFETRVGRERQLSAIANQLDDLGATVEANAEQAYKQAVVDCCASDIVYSNLFTGIHRNYLRPSIEAAELDPDSLPESDPSAMNFGSGGGSDAKAWKDIWGCGQGICAVKDIVPAADLVVARLQREYPAARQRLLAG